MKKITLMAATVLVSLAMVSCGQNKSTQPKANGLEKAGDAPAAGEIAYVEVDSLNSQLDMCKDALARLEAQHDGYMKQLDAKTAAFQKAYAEFAKKMQTSGYPTQAEYEAAQKRLQAMQESGAKFEQECQEKLAKEQVEFNKSLLDSVKAYIADLNKDHRYKLVLTKTTENILYCDPANDITKEVVDGMNKRYKKNKK